MTKVFSFVAGVCLLASPVNVSASWHMGDPIYSVEDAEETKLKHNITSAIFQASEVDYQFDRALRQNDLDSFLAVRDEYIKFVKSLYLLPESTQILLRREIVRAGRTYVDTMEKIDALTNEAKG